VILVRPIPPASDMELDESEAVRRYRQTLASVLAARPDHRTKAEPGASPKKRGRPPKVKPSLKPS
jgi:hypothetical protein